MPEMTGIEFLKLAAHIRPQTVRIILTGYTDINTLVEAINSGVVYKYVKKPWINKDLQQTVSIGLEHYETIKNQHELKQYNNRLSELLKATKEGFVNLIAEILNSKDQYAYGHALRTKGLAIEIGHYFNLDSEEIEQLSFAAYLRAIRHLAIPDDVLQREETFTEEKRRVVEGQAEALAVRMLEAIPGMEEIALVLRYQHEHYDGTRPPEHLGGEQIPLYARIISVVSTYDSLTNPRSSQKSLSHEEALRQLVMSSGKKFDPSVVKAFCELKAGF
jgi:response regulator RpfG family c-di-GMP phosphodiesterase